MVNIPINKISEPDGVHPRIIRSWADGMTARMNNVNALAVVATFLAAVQAQLISFTYQSNETSLQRMINSFSFIGLSCDVIGTALGLISALTMVPDQQRLNEATLEATKAYDEYHALTLELEQLAEQDRLSSGRSIPAQLMQDHLKQQRERMMRTHILETRKNMWQEENRGRAEEVKALGEALVVGNIKGLAPLLLMALGIICFFVALLGFVVNTQPTVVWGTTLATVIFGAIILPVDGLLHSRRTRARFARLWGARVLLKGRSVLASDGSKAPDASSENEKGASVAPS